METEERRLVHPLVARCVCAGASMNLTSFAKWQPRNGGGQFIAAKIDDAVKAGVTDWANRVFETSQELVAVDTGELKESGAVEVTQVGKQVFASVTYGTDHAVYVEFGTGIRGAASPGAGDGPYSPTWPGMPAQPYLRPAFDQHRDEAVGVLAETIASVLK
jgi:HK97 gp10 family phage protein